MKKQDSVFNVLRRIKQGKYSMADYLKDNHSSEDLIIYRKTGEPRDNIGRRIFNEVNSKFGFINPIENQLAMNYFKSDYQLSMRVSKRHIRTALDQLHYSKPQRFFLDNASKLIERASLDVDRSIEISPLTDGFLKGTPKRILSRDMEEQRDKVEIANKFPAAYHLIIPLYFRKKLAIEEEDYELAKDLDIRIRKCKSIPRTMAVHEDMRKEIDEIYQTFE